MKDYLKFLSKLPKTLRLKVILALEKIANNNTQGLDIKRLSSSHDLYRCRVGKIRIVFQKRDDLNYVLDLGFRGDIYSKLTKNF